jgi:hypothetical protein
MITYDPGVRGHRKAPLISGCFPIIVLFSTGDVIMIHSSAKAKAGVRKQIMKMMK